MTLFDDIWDALSQRGRDRTDIFQRPSHAVGGFLDQNLAAQSMTATKDKTGSLVAGADTNESGAFGAFEERSAIELFTANFDSGTADDVTITFQVQDGDGGTLAAPRGNPANFPITFDPGLEVPAGGFVLMQVSNETVNEIRVVGTILFREL